MNFVFELNGEEFSELRIGARRFKAFSGRESYRNKRHYQCVARFGPIPTGRYFIMDRPSGGRFGPVVDYVTGKSEWFALFADDGRVDDSAFCAELERGKFRLHPKGPRGISEGCVTLEHRYDFWTVRQLILGAKKFDVPGTAFNAYGTLVVR